MRANHDLHPPVSTHERRRLQALWSTNNVYTEKQPPGGWCKPQRPRSSRADPPDAPSPDPQAEKRPPLNSKRGASMSGGDTMARLRNCRGEVRAHVDDPWRIAPIAVDEVVLRARPRLASATTLPCPALCLLPEPEVECAATWQEKGEKRNAAPAERLTTHVAHAPSHVARLPSPATSIKIEKPTAERAAQQKPRPNIKCADTEQRTLPGIGNASSRCDCAAVSSRKLTLTPTLVIIPNPRQSDKASGRAPEPSCGALRSPPGALAGLSEPPRGQTGPS